MSPAEIHVWMWIGIAVLFLAIIAYWVWHEWKPR